MSVKIWKFLTDYLLSLAELDVSTHAQGGRLPFFCVLLQSHSHSAAKMRWWYLQNPSKWECHTVHLPVCHHCRLYSGNPCFLGSPEWLMPGSLQIGSLWSYGCSTFDNSKITQNRTKCSRPSCSWTFGRWLLSLSASNEIELAITCVFPVLN